MEFLVTTLIFVVVGIIASLCTRICCNTGPCTNSLIMSLLDSLNKKDDVKKEDDFPTSFDDINFKLRHEPVIKSLYADMPRQCTCGMRFKSHEDHSKHMDRHVVKNREAKKAKQQRQKPKMDSRMWFARTDMWLAASAEVAAAPGFSKADAPVANMKKKIKIG